MFWDNYVTLCNKVDKSPFSVTEELNLSNSVATHWKRGSVPRDATLLKIANYFNVTVDDLLKDTKKTTLPKNLSYVKDMKFVNIPIVGKVSAGLGCYAEDNIVGYQPIPASYVIDGEDYVMLTVRGDSMSPKMDDGDRVLIKCQTSVDSGSFAVVLIDGEEGVIKKVVYDSNHIELISINPTYPPRIFEGEDIKRVTVFGAVKQAIRIF